MPQPDVTSELQTPVSSFQLTSLQPMLTEQENEDKIPIKNKNPSALKTLACPCCSQLTMAPRMTAG